MDFSNLKEGDILFSLINGKVKFEGWINDRDGNPYLICVSKGCHLDYYLPDGKFNCDGTVVLLLPAEINGMITCETPYKFEEKEVYVRYDWPEYQFIMEDIDAIYSAEADCYFLPKRKVIEYGNK